MVDNYIAIIDIGTTKIVSMVGRKDPNGNMQILGFAERASEGVNRGLVLNIKEASEVIEEVVKDTIAQQLNGKFHISIIKDTSLNILKRSVNIANLNIKNTVLEPVASAKAVLSEEEKDGGVALLDIGGGTTDLIIFKDGIVRYTAVIPFGGNSITKDLQDGCKIIYSKAEEIKKQYGSAIPDLVNKKESVTIPGIHGRESKDISFETIAEIIQARVIEIIDTAYKEIKKSQYLDKLSAGLTITGGGSLLKHLKELIEFRTGLETRIAYPEDFIYSNSNRISDPKYATAIGLLKKAYEYQETENIKYYNQSKLLENDIVESKTESEEIEEQKIPTDKKGGIFKDAIKKLRDFLIDDDEIIDDDKSN